MNMAQLMMAQKQLYFQHPNFSTTTVSSNSTQNSTVSTTNASADLNNTNANNLPSTMPFLNSTNTNMTLPFSLSNLTSTNILQNTNQTDQFNAAKFIAAAAAAASGNCADVQQMIFAAAAAATAAGNSNTNNGNGVTETPSGINDFKMLINSNTKTNDEDMDESNLGIIFFIKLLFYFLTLF